MDSRLHRSKLQNLSRKYGSCRYLIYPIATSVVSHITFTDLAIGTQIQTICDWLFLERGNFDFLLPWLAAFVLLFIRLLVVYMNI